MSQLGILLFSIAKDPVNHCSFKKRMPFMQMSYKNAWSRNDNSFTMCKLFPYIPEQQIIYFVGKSNLFAIFPEIFEISCVICIVIFNRSIFGLNSSRFEL